MDNIFKSAGPEQKLAVLLNEILTPTEVIRGFAAVIKKEIESNNIDPARLLSDINKISQAADQIKKIREDVIESHKT